MSKDSKIPEIGNNIPDDCLLRVAQIVERIRVSRSHWYAGVKDGKYPPGFLLSKRVHVWRGRDIKAIINSEAAQ